jgi:hypothetical protein
MRLYYRFSATSPCANRQFRRPETLKGAALASNPSRRLLLWTSGSAQAVRQFSRQHFGRWRVQLRASRKEPFDATRECLFGMWQTGKCRECNVLMVRTTEEVVFRPPGGDVEGRAIRNRVSAQARGRRFILTWFTRALRRGLARDCTRGQRPFHHPAGWKARIRKVVK